MVAMATTFWIVIPVLAVLLVSVAVVWPGARSARQQQGFRIRHVIGVPLTIVVVLVVAACGRAPSEKTVHRLADSPEATKARQQAELASRDVIAAWDADTPLSLGLVVLQDVCTGGKAKEWFFSNGDDRYKIRCEMYVTAYFGADPRSVADTLDGVLTAGDRADSPIPFNHDFHYARMVVDYYRGNTGDPQGPGTGEPTHLSNAGSVTFSWDQVRSGDTRELIEEPSLVAYHDPPMKRLLLEPASTSVADLRREHGMVFKITMAVNNYFTVRK